jgi:ATP-dependent Clp protease ATP-binding subunit ClpA
VGASLALCREKVVEALASRPSAPPDPGKELPFTDRASRALERASKVSLRMSSEEVSAGHVLLSVLDIEGTAGQVLRGLGVDPATVRQQLASASSSAGASHNPSVAAVAAVTAEREPDTHRRVAAPICGACGAPLPRSLDHVVLTVGSDDSVARVDVFYCTVCGTAMGAMPAP